jgi:hypothetical protein
LGKFQSNDGLIHPSSFIFYPLISFPKVSFAFPQDSDSKVKVSFSKKEDKWGQFLCCSICFNELNNGHMFL